MKANFTFDEMVYNSVCTGKQIWYTNLDGTEELKTIDYVKLDKHSRQIIVTCTDGDTFLCKQDDVHTFEVTIEKPLNIPTLKRLNGK